MMMISVEQLVEWEFVGEDEALREKLPQYHFVLGSNLGRRSWKPATNRLSYGAALARLFNDAENISDSMVMNSGMTD
jgi:hypothetical protein